MEEEFVFFSLVLVVVLGAMAQWMGWRFKIPSILILLLAGFIAGPITGIFEPDKVFGHLLFPAVSAAVAVILFEGGLTLRFRELKKSGAVIFRLVFVGVIVTWAAASYLAYNLLGFDKGMAALFGALLSVTGPTVIGPMLRAIRPKGHVKNIAKWEGILIDPVGVLLAVFIFEIYIHTGLDKASSVILWGVVKTLLIGGVLSGLAAGLLLLAIKAKMIPEYLHNQFVLSLVLLSFGLSNMLQHESGLLTATLLGIILANQRIFDVAHILHFKENLRTLLISTLFIVLAARVDAATVKLLDFRSIVFLVALIVLVRPVAVLVSTLGSNTTWKERVLLMLLAPRGIVAVALTSVFALELIDHGKPQAHQMLAVTLLVIVGTVLFYGLAAGKVAAKLGLSNLSPEGVLFIGAQSWARELAKKLRDAGAYVMFVDTNRNHIGRARADGFDGRCGSVLNEEFLEDIEFSEIGHAIAITQNNEVNAFAQTTLIEFIERSHIYQLPPEEAEEAKSAEKKSLNPLFSEAAKYSYINKQIAAGAKFQTHELKEDFDHVNFEENTFGNILPLFGVDEDGKVNVFTDRDESVLKKGASLIYLELAKQD